ncbi:AraC family transcriptional regulator [Flavobacterium sp. LS1R49]|uniref:AraC family transcriptional regulator n=1 Tax=Flavobacterium shii TaxID=2987687 RepID=A0A9X2ZAN0_9FLAO|nr:helix-turn-helix domain-containing protein [Flavobacterium shii]MCV9927339.1 AraC family transcriptional regulator [Flavobacterium shii]
MNLGKWIKFIKENINFYRDGFFELPYLSNSPEVLVKSIINSPSVRHVQEEQAVYRNNPFSKGVMRYREIEEGFWIIVTSITFKKNVMLKAVYDEDVPSDYYTITFSVFESEVKLQNTFADKTPFSSKYWGFKRPGTEVGAYFYKGSVCEFYLYGFSKEWAERNFSFETLPEDNQIKKFLNSDKGFITYQDIVPNAAELSKEILINLQNNNRDLLSKSILKTQTFQLITTFFKNAFIDQRIGNYIPTDTPDYRKIAKAEKLLLDTVSAPFLGVEYIAEKVSMSPTKLKLTFKSVHGTSMMQYHKEKKLLLAMQIIQNTDMQIKNIAFATGYKSSSKFTASFKKRFGKLPSEVRGF